MGTGGKCEILLEIERALFEQDTILKGRVVDKLACCCWDVLRGREGVGGRTKYCKHGGCCARLVFGSFRLFGLL